jgi:hypothetical protein
LAANPVSQDNKTGKSVSSESIIQYYGRVKEKLKNKFPNNDLWAEETWYTKIKNDLKTAILRRQITGAEDYKDPKCRAIYKHVEPTFVRATVRSIPGWDKVAGADLEGICHSLIKSALRAGDQNFTMRCYLVVTALGVGRGGERLNFCAGMNGCGIIFCSVLMEFGHS